MDKIKKLAKELSQEIRSIEERGGYVWGTFLTSNMIEDYFFKKIAEALAERDARIKELEAELSRIKEGAEWISVEERLPERETAVLAFGKDWLGVGVCLMSNMSDIDIYGEYCWRWYDDRFPVKNNNVTHWMPLPAPPNLKSDPDRLMKGSE